MHHYSIKKKHPSQKAQLITDLNTERILATDFCNGKQNDFQLFKQGHHIMAEHIRILADVNYQGVLSFHSDSQTPVKKSKLQPLSRE